MKYLLQSVMLSIVLLIAVSCNDDDDTMNTKGQVAFTMKGSNGSNSSGRVMSDLEITSATAAITKVELEGGEGEENDSTANETENETEFEGQYTVNLLSGTSDPAFGTAEVEAQHYTELEVEFGTFLQDNASIIIEGNYTNDSGETVPFKFSLNKAMSLELENENGFQVKASALKELVATLDFSVLFQGVDFDLGEPNADGKVIVNSSLNTYVYNLISQHFNGAIEIEVDGN